MDIIEMLTQFNLTRQEATIYLTLLSQGAVNGYEVSKITGISRSNAYSSLAGLVEKGGAYAIEGSTIQYKALSVEEFCNNRINRLIKYKEELIKIVPNKKQDNDGYITIKGEEHILDKMKNMILEAQKRVYVSVSNQILSEILPELNAAIKKDIKIVVITDIITDIKGAKTYFTQKANQQIRLIADSSNVLTGDIDNGDASTCLYSKKKNLIDLLKDSLKNEIKLIEIIEKGGQL